MQYFGDFGECRFSRARVIYIYGAIRYTMNDWTASVCVMTVTHAVCGTLAARVWWGACADMWRTGQSGCVLIASPPPTPPGRAPTPRCRPTSQFFFEIFFSSVQVVYRRIKPFLVVLRYEDSLCFLPIGVLSLYPFVGGSRVLSLLPCVTVSLPLLCCS